MKENYLPKEGLLTAATKADSPIQRFALNLFIRSEKKKKRGTTEAEVLVQAMTGTKFSRATPAPRT